VTGRVIHDLSFPDSSSVNSQTDRSAIPRPCFENCLSIAREVLRCKQADPDADVKLMAGDVATAYRNAHTHSESVHRFAGHIPKANAIVVDMATAFSWTGSAGTYGVLGGAVAYVHGCSADAAPPKASTTIARSTITSTSSQTWGHAVQTPSAPSGSP
jgi:hypothetical protein